MNNKLLYNQKNKNELLKKIKKEKFNRTTLSFYKYVNLNELDNLRNDLFLKWNKLKVLGRVYLAKEGINAQISIPEKNLQDFKATRNKEFVTSILNKLKNAANTKENLMPLIVEAVKSNATIGEISDALRSIFDEYKG